MRRLTVRYASVSYRDAPLAGPPPWLASARPCFRTLRHPGRGRDIGLSESGYRPTLSGRESSFAEIAPLAQVHPLSHDEIDQTLYPRAGCGIGENVRRDDQTDDWS